MKDAVLGAGTPATQVQDPERAGSWLWPRLAPTVEAIWEMNHKIEKKNLLFSFQIHCFKKCTWFSCNKAIYFFSKVQKCLLQVLSFFLPTLLLRGLPGSTQSRVLRQHSAKEKGADRTECTTDRLQQTHKPQKLGSSAGEVPNTHEGGPHSMSGSRVTAALSLTWLPLPPINQQSPTWYLCGGPSTLMPTPHPHLQLRRRTNR